LFNVGKVAEQPFLSVSRSSGIPFVAMVSAADKESSEYTRKVL
jgi:hypothetical protein